LERIGASEVVRNDPSDMIVPPAAVTTMPRRETITSGHKIPPDGPLCPPKLRIQEIKLYYRYGM